MAMVKSITMVRLCSHWLPVLKLTLLRRVDSEFVKVSIRSYCRSVNSNPSLQMMLSK